jgi:hypothetical protein
MFYLTKVSDVPISLLKGSSWDIGTLIFISISEPLMVFPAPQSNHRRPNASIYISVASVEQPLYNSYFGVSRKPKMDKKCYGLP